MSPARKKRKLSASDEWATPRPLFDAISAQVGDGGFAVDLCASALNAKCKRFITKEQNALSLDWASLTPGEWQWLQPPFSKVAPNGPGHLDLFTDKMNGALMGGARIGGIVPASISSGWFQRNFLQPFRCRDVELLDDGPLRGTCHLGEWYGLHARIWWLSVPASLR
jgi:phage N-6-adenine-methyltransferase